MERVEHIAIGDGGDGAGHKFQRDYGAGVVQYV